MEKFPLTRHPSGQWCKKHKGRTYYFGTDKHNALRRYVHEWPEITAGRGRAVREPARPEVVTLDAVCNLFLAAKLAAVGIGELSPASYRHYHRVSQRILEVLGRTRPAADLRPPDYGRLRAHAAATLGPTSLCHFIACARALFAFGETLTDEPPRYGDQFSRPPARVLRLKRHERGERLLEAAELRVLIAAAGPVMRAQILLGLNAAFGATDLSELRQGHLDRKPGWVVLPRRKTGIGRRAPLWPETAAALEAAWQARPRPADPVDADRLFLSPHGLPCVRWTKSTGPGCAKDSVAAAWEALCTRTGVRKRKGSGFYALRRVFRTVADELPDAPAIDAVMGHTRDDMASHYRERIADARLTAVVEHVRAWLFGNRRY